MARVLPSGGGDGARVARVYASGEGLGLARVPRAFAIAALAWAVLCAASLAWSVNAGYTLQELRRELAYGALTFAVFFTGTRGSRELHLWIRVILVGAVGLGVGEWLRAALPNEAWARSVSMGPGPFTTHVLMVIPLLAIAAWREPEGMGWSLKATLATCVALLLAGLAGESRILWVALVAAAFVAFPAYAASLPRGHRAREIAARVFVAALIVLALLMVLTTEYKARYYPRAASTIEMLELDERPVIWKASAAQASEHPWIGHGYGRDIVADSLHRRFAAANVPPYNHGHSVLLDTALQLGVVGVAVLLALMGSLAWALTAMRRVAGGTPLAITGVALFAAYAVKNITDDFFYRPNSLVFWAIAGMLLGRAAFEKR